MTKKLPARPNLEHLRSQAKTLLAHMRDGDDAAARIFSKHLPEAKGLTPTQVRAAGFRLADAQAAVAHKNGFAEWPGLARYVERLRSLEGTWAFRTLEVDGEKMPIAALGESRLLIDGDRFRMESPDANYEGVFDIDIERTPHTIDIDFVDGPEAGNRSEGIFELDGDRLTICLGFAGESRPKAFTDHARQRPRARASDAGGSREARRRRRRHAAADGAGARPGVREGRRRVQRRGHAARCATLQGEWVPTELVTAGQALKPDLLAYGSRTFTGAETKVVFGGQTMVHAKVRINDAASPIEVDYLNLAGSKRGSISLGLMTVAGRRGRVLHGRAGRAAGVRLHVRERQRAHAQPLEAKGLTRAQLTTTWPVIFGCSPQKYLYVPAVSNRCENCPSVSSTGDLKRRSVLTMLCGTSS